jgi:hypothetical protein
MSIEIGKTYEVAYPFVLEEVDLPPDDPEGGMRSVKSWRPGVGFIHSDPNCDADSYADAFGQMLLTVVDVHKPGKYPARVFYTRKWRDPKGREFGKAGLRITTTPAFKRLLAGYRHEIDLIDEQSPTPNQ